MLNVSVNETQTKDEHKIPRLIILSREMSQSSFIKKTKVTGHMSVFWVRIVIAMKIELSNEGS